MSREKSGSSQSWGSHIVVMDAGGRVAAGRKMVAYEPSPSSSSAAQSFHSPWDQPLRRSMEGAIYEYSRTRV